MPLSYWRLVSDRSPVVLPVAMIAAGIIAALVLGSPSPQSYDLAVSSAFIDHRSPAVTTFAAAVTFLGSGWALTPLTLLTGSVLVLRRRHAAALLVVASMLTSWLVTNTLKNAVGRPRPDPADLLGRVSVSDAFPSGHTLNSAVFLGVVAATLVVSLTSRLARVITVLGAVLLGVAIGLSRVYLGYHWLSDVLGGWSVAMALLGAAWLCWLTRRSRHDPSVA